MTDSLLNVKIHENPILVNLHSLEAICLIHNNSALEGVNHGIVNSPFIIVYMRFPCLQATFTISTKLLRLNEGLQEGKSCTGANKDSNEDKKRSHLDFFMISNNDPSWRSRVFQDEEFSSTCSVVSGCGKHTDLLIR